MMMNRVLDLEWKDFSSDTIARAKWILADTLIVMLYGIRSSPESKRFMLNNRLSESMRDIGIQVPGSRVFLTPADAEILFGSSIVCNEMDEGNQYAKGHPAAHLVPAMFIASIGKKISGKEFLRAFIIGYEISARFGYASKMNDEMHPHGTWGIIGAAAALAILEEKSRDQILKIALIAATLPLSTSWQAAVTGQTVRNLYAGLGNFIASIVGKCASAGFRSSEHVVQHVWGHILSQEMEDCLFLDHLNAPLLINRNYFKLYPACRFSHTAIEAFKTVWEEHKITTSETQLVKVQTYSLSARLSDPDPKTLLAAKFSIPFLLSVLANGYSLFDTNKKEVFQNPAIRSFAKKIEIFANQEMSLKLPEKRPARIDVILVSGKVLSCSLDDAPDGFDENGLRKKHERLIKNWDDRDAVQNWLHSIIDIENSENSYETLSLL